MLEKTLVPSIEKRISSLLEFNRRKELVTSSKCRVEKRKPAITFSREFGCESHSVVEHLQELLEKRTGEAWLVMDKELMQEVARNHDLSEDVLGSLGEKPSFLDEMIATFSPRWKSDKDYYQLLCRHVVALADQVRILPSP
jgi:hypothetical protein